MDDSTQATTAPAVDDRPEEAPQSPTEPAPPIASRFLFVDVAALRAKQLRRGAHSRLEEDNPPAAHKAERVAMEEVRRGLVYYDVPGPRPGEQTGNPVAPVDR
jgi:DNA-directed RNA polymerase subunit K/omega